MDPQKLKLGFTLSLSPKLAAGASRWLSLDWSLEITFQTFGELLFLGYRTCISLLYPFVFSDHVELEYPGYNGGDSDHPCKQTTMATTFDHGTAPQNHPQAASQRLAAD
jgi:hypothetical protein